MSLDLTWRIARLHQLIRRALGSLALRGWKGTLRRIAEQTRARHGDDAPVAASIASDTWDAAMQGRRRILAIDGMAPHPARDSGSLRLCMMLRLLHEDGWHVDLLADDGRMSAADAARLAEYGIHAHHGSPMRWLREHGQTLDAVLLCRLSVAAQYLSPSKRLAPKATASLSENCAIDARRKYPAAVACSNKRRHRNGRNWR